MTEKEILDYLDLCEFPMLDNGYYYHADQELRIYRNSENWFMTLQVLQYNNHSLGVDGFSTIVYKYGSKMNPEESFNNDSFYHLAKDVDHETFIEEPNTFNSFLNPLAKQLQIRDTIIQVEHDPSKYEQKEIKLETEGKIRPWEILRFITPEFSSLFWLNNKELGIDITLKEELRLSNWEHPDNVDTLFSDMLSFKEIAKSISNNSEFHRTKIETTNSNTHWSNWPLGGTL